MRKLTLAIFTTAMLASPAMASQTVDFVEVDNSAALTGYRTYDIMVTSDYDWNSTALLLEMFDGSIYQDPAGTSAPPNPAFFSAFPSLEFDTYVGVAGGGGGIAGGAGDVGGDTFVFSTSELDVSFYNISKDDIGTFSIGRFTVTDGASGLMYLATRAGPDRATYDIFLDGGYIDITWATWTTIPSSFVSSVPEPTSMMTLAVVLTPSGKPDPGFMRESTRP